MAQSTKQARVKPSENRVSEAKAEHKTIIKAETKPDKEKAW